jgi:hypothetical protein
MAKVVHVNVGESGRLEGPQPDALTEVAVVQGFACWAREDQITAAGASM